MSRPVSLVAAVFALSFASACAGATPPPNVAPTPSQKPDAPPEKPKPEAPDATLPGDAEKVPPPPASCQAFQLRKSGLAGTCDEKSTRKSLALALEKTDAEERDALLQNVDGCGSLPPGFVRALRAELAPVECGDLIVEPLLASPPAGLEPSLRDTLMGLAYAARAARLVREPPKLAPPFGKERVNQFVSGPLRQWIEGQAKAIYSVSLHGSNLEGYGKGLVAVEAGLADLRFVEVARNAPVPDEMAKDAELKEAYLAALEQALEPRKNRGRDAALVGLKKLADEGVIDDPRVARARKLLSQVYAGRRIDALDSLLVPSLPAQSGKSELETLALGLPTPYAERLLGNEKLDTPILRALLERGLPKGPHKKLEADRKLGPEARRLYARALVRLGQRYWRAADFSKASSVLGQGKLAPAQKAEAELLVALATALATGPKDATEMMAKGVILSDGVKKLDELAKGKGEVAGMAAFDAARLLEIARPTTADAAYFKGIAERYEKAKNELANPAQKQDAADRAKAASDTAAAVGH